jgi:hypothetical protein
MEEQIETACKVLGINLEGLRRTGEYEMEPPLPHNPN